MMAASRNTGTSPAVTEKLQSDGAVAACKSVPSPRLSVLNRVSHMKEVKGTCPLSREQVVGQYFLEHRAKLLDVAAFLDRLDRATPAGAPDFRELALREALAVLTDGAPHRVARVLDLLSDASPEIPQSAHGMKGASGAVKPVAGVLP